MNEPPATFTPIEWRLLARACEQAAAKERKRAEEIGGRPARDYLISAEYYERLAEQCLRRARL